MVSETFELRQHKLLGVILILMFFAHNFACKRNAVDLFLICFKKKSSQRCSLTFLIFSIYKAVDTLLFHPFRCLQTNGTKGCPKCFKSSMKPGFVWLWDCVCALDLQTQGEASQAPDWSESSRQPQDVAEDVWGVIIHCSVHRMLNWTESVTEFVSEDTIKASTFLKDIRLSSEWGGVTETVTSPYKLKKKEPTLSLTTGHLLQKLNQEEHGPFAEHF